MSWPALILAGLLVVALGGCGSGPPPSTSATPAGSAGDPAPAATATTPPDASGEASASTRPSVADACPFLPAEAVAAAFDLEAVTASPTPGDGDVSYCNYSAADGTSVLATSYTTKEGVFDSYAAVEDVVEVPDVGDAAIFTDGLLMIREGDEVLSIQAGDTGLAGDELLPALTEVARAAAPRLGSP